jgi:hypothetical protein
MFTQIPETSPRWLMGVVEESRPRYCRDVHMMGVLSERCQRRRKSAGAMEMKDVREGAQKGLHVVGI